MTQVIYSPDGRIMSAAPPGFIPGTPYGVGTERIDVCPYFARGQNGCTNPVCPMLHPGMIIDIHSVINMLTCTYIHIHRTAHSSEFGCNSYCMSRLRTWDLLTREMSLLPSARQHTRQRGNACHASTGMYYSQL